LKRSSEIRSAKVELPQGNDHRWTPSFQDSLWTNNIVWLLYSQLIVDRLFQQFDDGLKVLVSNYNPFGLIALTADRTSNSHFHNKFLQPTRKTVKKMLSIGWKHDIVFFLKCSHWKSSIARLRTTFCHFGITIWQSCYQYYLCSFYIRQWQISRLRIPSGDFRRIYRESNGYHLNYLTVAGIVK